MRQLNDEVNQHPRRLPMFISVQHLNVGDIRTAKTYSGKLYNSILSGYRAHRNGSFFAAQSKYPLVFAELNQAIKMGDESTSTNALWESAFIHREIKDYDTAIEQFTKVLKSKSLQPQRRGLILEHRGETYYRMGKIDDGLADLQNSVSLYPEYMYSHIALAQLFARKNRDAEAIKQYTLVLDTERALSASQMLGGIASHLRMCYSERAAEYRKIGKIDLSNKDIRTREVFERSLMQDLPFR